VPVQIVATSSEATNGWARAVRDTVVPRLRIISSYLAEGKLSPSFWE